MEINETYKFTDKIITENKNQGRFLHNLRVNKILALKVSASYGYKITPCQCFSIYIVRLYATSSGLLIGYPFTQGLIKRPLVY